jgi:hypothetical protein
MKERYTVYIPTVPLTAGRTVEAGGSLLEIYAEPFGSIKNLNNLPPEQAQEAQQAQTLNNKAIRKQWERVAAPLYTFDVLYKSGITAVASVQKLGLKRPLLAIYQWWKRQAYIESLRLYLAGTRTVDNAPHDWRSASHDVDGYSAELGLALALLMTASQAPHHLVIATGRLSGQPSGTSIKDPDDVEVLSVGKLPEKLRLIERLAIDKKLPRGRDHKDPVWLFTPTTFDNGEGVKTLPEAGRLKDLGIAIIPVKTLGEAAGHLKAERARWMWQDGAMLGGIACLPLILSAMIYWWPKPPLPVTLPNLEINVLDQESNAPEPLQKVPNIYLDQELILGFSSHPDEFRYLLQLHSDGDTYIDFLPPEIITKKMEMKKFPPPNLTLLMLVTGKSWSENQQRNLAKMVSDLRLQPKLSPRVQYRFTTEGCTPVNIASIKIAPTNIRGPRVPLEDPSPNAVCAAWAMQLLETLKQQTQEKIRLSGCAFQVAPY